MRPSYPVERLDYELPPELIAQQPPAERGASRLLHVRADPAAPLGGSFTDRQFAELPELLPPETLIVLNDSRVIPARLHGRRHSGGAVELLYLEHLGDGVIRAVVGSNAKLGAGEVVELPADWRAELLEPKALDGIRVQVKDAAGNALDLSALLTYLREHGEMPLPPYIKREDEQSADRERYQTVYAAAEGSVAAPTAGLHFTEALLEDLTRRGHRLARVTLHVGTGTFAPLRVADLADHEMYAEPYSVERAVAEHYFAARAAGRPVLAVGTTSLRILHTLRPYANLTGTTNAFIYPGHGTDAADLLLTNFHLPRSTLLALVYAFGGEELMRAVYAHAVAQRYRFFSYGDCMLIDRRPRE